METDGLTLSKQESILLLVDQNSRTGFAWLFDMEQVKDLFEISTKIYDLHRGGQSDKEGDEMLVIQIATRDIEGDAFFIAAYSRPGSLKGFQNLDRVKDDFKVTIPIRVTS